MSMIINVGVGGTDEDKDVRKGTYKTLKRKQYSGQRINTCFEKGAKGKGGDFP